MKRLIYFVCFGLVCLAATGWAADVTLTASDGLGTSSFNSGLNWSDKKAPSAGNNYIVPGTVRLRTPADGGSYTFAGNLLRLDAGGTQTDQLGLAYKGTGSSGSITVNNLILNGGKLCHINGGGDLFNLYGNITVTADSVMWAKQGPINVVCDDQRQRRDYQPAIGFVGPYTDLSFGRQHLCGQHYQQRPLCSGR